MARVSPEEFPDPVVDSALATTAGQSRAILAGGCFWCVEAVYKNLDGVSSVNSGYAGGTADTADYETVSTGTTDHAESVEVVYDPSRISYGQILKVFFAIAHDPTQLNRQGPDTGRQYRSAIFYADDEQKRVAEAYIDQLNKADVFDHPIVTEVVPLQAFYQGEADQQEHVGGPPAEPAAGRDLFAHLVVGKRVQLVDLELAGDDMLRQRAEVFDFHPRKADAFEIGRVEGEQLGGGWHPAAEALGEPARDGPRRETRDLLADDRVDEHAEGITQRTRPTPRFRIDRFGRIDQPGELSIARLQRRQGSVATRGSRSRGDRPIVWPFRGARAN